MSLQILKLLESTNSAFQEKQKILSTAKPTEEIKHPDRCISNFGLLLKAIGSFFSSDIKSGYFPSTLSRELESELLTITNSLKSLPEPDVEEFSKSYPQTLAQMDAIYAKCLMTGLITFGFDVKLLAELQQTIKSQSDAFMNLVGSLNRDLLEESSLLREQISKIRSEVNADFDQSRKLVQSRVEEIVSLKDACQLILDNLKRDSEENQKHVLESKASLDNMTTLCTGIVERISIVEEGVKTSQKAIVANISDAKSALDQIEEYLVKVKASSSQASDARANISEQLESIKQFYGEIEKHKTQMLDVKNSTEVTLRELREQTEQRLAEFKNNVDGYNESTKAIVDRNNSLQEEIQDHLRRAVGASLFAAFDQRKRLISFGKWVWFGILTVSAGGAILYAYWFAISLHEVFGNGSASEQSIGTEAELVLTIARIVIAIPIGFVIVFCANQYSRERRAEEEYAFKSTISVSLEPYKTLIESMTAEGKAVDADYIKKLILIIFENPTERLYADRTGNNLTTKQIALLMKEIKPLMDSIKSTSEIPPKK